MVQTGAARVVGLHGMGSARSAETSCSTEEKITTPLCRHRPKASRSTPSQNSMCRRVITSCFKDWTPKMRSARTGVGLSHRDYWAIRLFYFYRLRFVSFRDSAGRPNRDVQLELLGDKWVQRDRVSLV